MTVSLKAMQYFNLAVARGSIAQAADELNIAASAVSAAIDQVEASFGLTLVTRQRARGIAPTASGRLMVRKFERLLEDYRAILEEGAELKQSLSGALRVGYYAPVAPAFLPSIFSAFLPPESDAVLHLEECDNDAAQEGLLNGAYDVILFVSEGAKAAIEFDVLIEAPAYCLLAADHPLAAQDTVSLADLAQEPLVVLDRPVAAPYYLRLFEGAHTKTNVVAYANSTEMVRSLVGAGRGCAVLNMLPLADTSYSGERLVGRPISDDLPPLTLSVAYNRTQPRRIVQHFVDACRAYFAAEGPHQCIVR
ncbi:LysR family transcriptional regulator [Pelagovum sp. HNIBRBA483]|uniref:LysR family transcriptional regulator n=1 Tax=Pelagovum sp. HNIBRBA483 TaxID=3233341 RepID=UPI0034A4B2AA